MTAIHEKQLVEAALRGEPAALGEVLELYQQRIYNVVLRMVSNPDDAREITQDAMTKIIEKIGQFQGRSTLATWMIRIAMNLSISHLRKRRTRAAASLDDAPGNGGSGDSPAPLGAQLAQEREPSPDRNVQDSEMLELLQVALKRIDEEFRSVLVLRDLEQMDYQEIAQVLSLPIGTVKSRLFRARLTLRQEMLKLCPPPARSAPPETTHG